MISSKSIKFLISALFTVMTFNVAFADDAAPKALKTEIGFKRITDPSTPEFIKNASQSVFEIRMIADEKPQDLKVVDLTDPKFKDLESKVQSIPQLDDKEKLLISKQIQNCRVKGREKQCSLFFTIEKATGFIAVDGETLWTNAHVIQRYIQFLVAVTGKTVEETLQGHPTLPIFLFDQTGKLVFDSILDTAELASFDSPSAAATSQQKWYSEDTDFVKIKLSKKIAEPLKVGKKPASNEKLFRPGFAACTGCAAQPNTTDPLLNLSRGPGKDSTGEGMWWTSGTNSSVEEAASFFGVPMTFFKSYKADQMLFFSADAQVGLSGAPILNSAGEVVGIFAGSKAKADQSGTMTVLSRGVRPPQFK